MFNNSFFSGLLAALHFFVSVLIWPVYKHQESNELTTFQPWNEQSTDRSFVSFPVSIKVSPVNKVLVSQQNLTFAVLSWGPCKQLHRMMWPLFLFFLFLKTGLFTAWATLVWYKIMHFSQFFSWQPLGFSIFQLSLKRKNKKKKKMHFYKLSLHDLVRPKYIKTLETITSIMIW